MLETTNSNTKHALPKMLLLGSGPLAIGQAGEFDYSGTQAIKALIERGFEVLLINPNIATVQTTTQVGVKVFLYPLTSKWAEHVIRAERPLGIIAGFGGQTAINLLLELEDLGILKRYGIKNYGTSIETIKSTEDRELFRKLMEAEKIPVLKGAGIISWKEAKVAAQQIGFPLIVRSAFSLGGLDSGFAQTEEELHKLVDQGLVRHPQLLLEKSVLGWKELEYEIMRDAYGNAIAICNMENIDPMGVHTGDSMVVVPSQTLTDFEFQRLRTAALKIAHVLKIIGECNVQFALSPTSSEFYVIEVNARLSRSSALASKASGYPIAYLAAKVALGDCLLDLKNPVTGNTSAFFEPALDYVTVKIPKWDNGRFIGVNSQLGSSMKSIGEAMAIGRDFKEAFQKALRMVTPDSKGILYSENRTDSQDCNLLPTDDRIFRVLNALRASVKISEICHKTSINEWFLEEFRQILLVEDEIRTHAKGSESKHTLSSIEVEKWTRWKQCGFSDSQIASLLGLSAEQLVRDARIKIGLHPKQNKIDTTAGEYPTITNYSYLTYHHNQILKERQLRNSKVTKESVLVLGAGPYCIGNSVEFDWCTVQALRRLREKNFRTIVVNCNPETVSTDYNESDSLYFEEITEESIFEINEIEECNSVIVSMGGQGPNRLARRLSEQGVNILGHSSFTIDQAENRETFSSLLDRLDIRQPRWTVGYSKDQITSFINTVGYPILVRPSYVLSGASMKVATSSSELDSALKTAQEVSETYPVVISEFIEDAMEVEVDGVSSQGVLKYSVIGQHLEKAGVHSGDATIVIPPLTLSARTIDKLKEAIAKISQNLGLNGVFNIQFLVKGETVFVIECNPRASRSTPFVSKVTGVNLPMMAIDILTHPIVETAIPPMSHFGVKAAHFSFSRLVGLDPICGVEMISTGEVGCISKKFHHALVLAIESTGIVPPSHGILISSGPSQSKALFLETMPWLEKLGIPLYATHGSATHLRNAGYAVTELPWPGELETDVIRAIQKRRIDFVINIPKNKTSAELKYSRQIRSAAIQSGCSLLTDIEKTRHYLRALGQILNEKNKSSDSKIQLKKREAQASRPQIRN